MAYDKAVDSGVLNAGLTSIADAIRTKGGTSDAMAFPAGFVAAIESMQTGGGELKYATGTFKNTVFGNTLTFSGLAFEPVIVMTGISPTDPPTVIVAPNWNVAKYSSSNYTCTMAFANGVCTLTASGKVFFGTSSGTSYTWRAWGY